MKTLFLQIVIMAVPPAKRRRVFAPTPAESEKLQAAMATGGIADDQYPHGDPRIASCAGCLGHGCYSLGCELCDMGKCSRCCGAGWVPGEKTEEEKEEEKKSDSEAADEEEPPEEEVGDVIETMDKIVRPINIQMHNIYLSQGEDDATAHTVSKSTFEAWREQLNDLMDCVEFLKDCFCNKAPDPTPPANQLAAFDPKTKF